MTFTKALCIGKAHINVTGVKIVISAPPPLPLFSNSVKNQYRRKYAGRTNALEKQNYKTSKIARGTSMTSWAFLINWRNWIIYIRDTNHSFHTEKGVIFVLNCYS